ncbi:hypothetical protein BDW22DRAFT_925006 [Trametopsis cervina]|nr:hypothetical protein BDW22DRAFT_925006 [Trametopsis cervina]
MPAFRGTAKRRQKRPCREPCTREIAIDRWSASFGFKVGRLEGARREQVYGRKIGSARVLAGRGELMGREKTRNGGAPRPSIAWLPPPICLLWIPTPIDEPSSPAAFLRCALPSELLQCRITTASNELTNCFSSWVGPRKLRWHSCCCFWGALFQH